MMIKKTIIRKLVLNNGEYIPDSATTYNFVLNLTSNNIDLGMFNGVPTDYNEKNDANMYTVSGYTSSKLSQLKNLTSFKDLARGYVLLDIINTETEKNGVDLDESTDNYIVYYINDIKYIDFQTTGVTWFEFERDDDNNINNNFYNYPIIKDDNLFEIINNPRVIDETYLERNGLEIMKDMYKLKDIVNLRIAQYYGGNYFYIKKDI